MAVSVNIRAFARTKVISGDAGATIAKVSLTIGGILMVSMADGTEYKMGTITEPSTAVCICVPDTPKEIPTKILAQGVDVDDIRVFSALYIVQDANDVDVESVSRSDSYVTILLTNGETIRIGDHIKHACSIPPTVIPTPHPPLFTNSFASVLKILSDVELKDIENRVFLLEERMQAVEGNTSSTDISALKLQVATNTSNINNLDARVGVAFIGGDEPVLMRMSPMNRGEPNEASDVVSIVDDIEEAVIIEETTNEDVVVSQEDENVILEDSDETVETLSEDTTTNIIAQEDEAVVVTDSEAGAVITDDVEESVIMSSEDSNDIEVIE